LLRFSSINLNSGTPTPCHALSFALFFLCAMNSPGHDVLNALAADAVAPTFSLLGESAVMRAAREQIRKLAASSVPVAIYGESGSGKELAARDIHALSARSHQAFVPVNCGAIPESLMESEFFGVRRGAFTGATEDRPGFFQAAHCCTLFLDEIAELPLSMQVKLLRVIQEGKSSQAGFGAGGAGRC